MLFHPVKVPQYFQFYRKSTGRTVAWHSRGHFCFYSSTRHLKFFTSLRLLCKFWFLRLRGAPFGPLEFLWVPKSFLLFLRILDIYKNMFTMSTNKPNCFHNIKSTAILLNVKKTQLEVIKKLISYDRHEFQDQCAKGNAKATQ